MGWNEQMEKSTNPFGEDLFEAEQLFEETIVGPHVTSAFDLVIMRIIIAYK